MMFTRLMGVTVVSAFVGFAPTNARAKSKTPGTKMILSKNYKVDRKYRSMKGPQSTESFALGSKTAPELLWITGYRAVMVGGDGKSSMPQDFMCHSNLDVDTGLHREVLESEEGISGRLFTLSQGQFTISFPDGFGIPIISGEPLSLTTQVLNLNEEGQTFEVRHKVNVDFVRERDKKGMKPLFQKSAFGLKLLDGEDGHYGKDDSDEKHGPGCLAGANASDHTYDDAQGRKFTGHWVVPPGKEVNRTPVTELLSFPYDTTAHYIAVHLHPFAESLELVDLTAKKVVFKSKTRQMAGRIGLDNVQYFSSKEGVQMYKDHEYELVSVYNNTTKEEQDSMAVMYLYLLDKRYEAPDASDLKKAAKKIVEKKQ